MPRALAIPFVVYTLALGLASPGGAQAVDGEARAEIAALRDGDMRKLTIHEEPVAAPDTPFIGADGAETTLAASNGKVRLVNFWATWCAPCREEMPSLAALREAMAGEDFELLLIATGRNDPAAIKRFFGEIGLEGEATALDPQSRLARAAGAPGLPVTLILNREGFEIARLMGEADWNGESAQAIIAALAE
ncbi:TlpA disulfide reductase family protein [Amaricoccus sp.]|uniref:TlpA family protein disulfide reductase n=1 Tax=Amaricoccus sp. TaxID=1872485 RepID=UPI0025BC9678|nr:TlpA disulfide reductase family protein [Amaricoccus sp.]